MADVENTQEPALDKTAGEIFGDIGKRILLLVSKLISVKVVMFAAFVWLALARPDLVNGWMLVTMGGVVIFGREMLKYLPQMK